MNRVAKFVATGCLSGYCPLAPGTAGSALIAILYWLLPIARQEIWFSITFLLFFLGVFVSTQAERHWGRDASLIVVDEMVGFLAAVLFLPKIPLVIILGFFIFRFFDIVKPFPAHRSERLPGGWGVMTDDLIAGVYTNLVLRLILLLG
ncbi:MAG: phosphatidylglycerophosphatase A [Candidatus Latescibacterota bacterium]|nr:MAG: phosphatidylglycerophosphatase A [Candidatus Latescibacterota bacterium]RKY72847.1 MAG: phosphatidylglycerophosphatase A [Candidatus Latescibacterota bacterium]